jgi:SAM-dependent methyltransferase
MSDPFGQQYANAYDTLYRDKDYDGEAALLQRIFEQYGPHPVRRVLDLGCGTGNHSLRLAKLGYEVTGVDRSADMLGLARQKADEQHLSVRFQHSAIGNLALGETFDAALLMFAVLSYQHTNDDVLAALHTARSHLTAGGLLVFDVWYGPAVLTERPGERIRIIESNGQSTLRATSGTLDTRQHLCRVDYRLWQISGEMLTSHASESHWMRYFFPKELELFLSLTDFELLRLGAFPDINRDPDDTTWNTMAVAKRK